VGTISSDGTRVFPQPTHLPQNIQFVRLRPYPKQPYHQGLSFLTMGNGAVPRSAEVKSLSATDSDIISFILQFASYVLQTGTQGNKTLTQTRASGLTARPSSCSPHTIKMVPNIRQNYSWLQRDASSPSKVLLPGRPPA